MALHEVPKAFHRQPQVASAALASAWAGDAQSGPVPGESSPSTSAGLGAWAGSLALGWACVSPDESCSATSPAAITCRRLGLSPALQRHHSPGPRGRCFLNASGCFMKPF